MRKQRIKWLYNELPKLVSGGVLTSDDAENLRRYYGDADEGVSVKTALTIFGVLGAVLISAGIILLLAKNWPELSRPVRTVLALLPLLAGQILCGWVLLKRRGSIPWREGSSAFLAISIGAAISLVAQTYNIAGDTDSFILSWMLLLFPLIYLMDTTLPAIFYLAGITAWSGAVQSEGGYALLFWVLLGLLGPYAYRKFKENPYSNSSVFLCWAISIALCAAIGITLEKVLPGLWIVIYGSYFTILYLTGTLWFKHAAAFWQRPLQTVGGAGILTVSCLLTYKWPWEHIGWDFYRHTYGFHEVAGVFDYVIAAGLLGISLYLVYTCICRKKTQLLLFGAAPLLAAAAYILASVSDSYASQALYNLYLLVLGTGTVVRGVRSRELGLANGGMVILALLAVLRFFDESLGFLVRGIAFILVGAGFLAANVIIIRKQGRKAA